MLVLGTTQGVFVVSEQGAAAPAGLADCNVYALCRANGSLFAATADGVYRSADDARSWQRVGLAGCKVMTVQPSSSDERLLYAGTQPPALYQSRDGGESWTEVE